MQNEYPREVWHLIKRFDRKSFTPNCQSSRNVAAQFRRGYIPAEYVAQMMPHLNIKIEYINKKPRGTPKLFPEKFMGYLILANSNKADKAKRWVAAKILNSYNISEQKIYAKTYVKICTKILKIINEQELKDYSNSTT